MKNSVIYITLPPTQGLTGRDWADWFEKTGREIKEEEKRVLLSRKFKPTRGVVRKLAIITDSADDNAVDKNDFVILRPREAVDPEIACQLRRTFSSLGLSDLDIWYFATISAETERNYFNRRGCDSPDGWWER